MINKNHPHYYTLSIGGLDTILKLSLCGLTAQSYIVEEYCIVHNVTSYTYEKNFSMTINYRCFNLWAMRNYIGINRCMFSRSTYWHAVKS